MVRFRVIIIAVVLAALSMLVVTPAMAQSPVWTGQYYNNPTLFGDPVVTRTDANIAFNWGIGAPADGVNADNFSVRWATDVFLNAGTYRFYALGDDKIRVTFNFGSPVIDTFNNPAVGQTVSADVNVPVSGTYHIQIDYQELTDNAYAYFSFANLATNPTGPNFGAPNLPISGGPWTAQYYSNTALSGDPVAIISEASPSHNWGAGAPLPSVPADNFSARWTSVQTLSGGNYVLQVRADDGVRVFVNGVLVINQFGAATGQTYTANLNLPAGQHSFQVEYVEFGGNAFLDYQLLQPGAPTAVPTTQPTGTTATVTAFRLNVRAQPNATAQVLTRINRFETYPVVGRSDDGLWYQINLGNQTGWVSSRWVTISGNVPATSVPGQTGILVTATPYTVNIRSGAGTQHSRIGRLPAGSTAQVIGRNSNNTWWQINYNGIVGWVAAEYAVIQQGANVGSIPVTG
ncbi:MAG TPA: PA14 domain-containing protein [Oceanobacillus sp.]|nr:PA14 domain-containing protein [Oceanobacillus sp.]